MIEFSRRLKHLHYILLILTGLVYLGSRTISPPSAGPEGEPRYAGTAACVSCHRAICTTHEATAHYHTSAPADTATVKGSFRNGRNQFIYNRFAKVVMERKDDGLYQTSYLNGNEVQSERFDISVGSGRKGQTYLYWKGDFLFQLPVSYYTPADDWCNSPGYTRNFPLYDRLIPARCMECHGTWARTEKTGQGGRFINHEVIYGITCERCHGPASEHVAWHTQHPGEKTGRYILNAAHLSRQQRLDACALCHSGPRDEIRPAFSFQTGDTLDRFSTPRYSRDSLPTLDVHGNQYGLLLSSKCFRRSAQMDCSSCHNTHADEAGQPALFSRRCMTCHNGNDHPTCSLPDVTRLRLTNNCIDCHMPALPSQKIFLQLSDTSRSTPDLVRTHRVAVYPESTEKFLEKINPSAH